MGTVVQFHFTSFYTQVLSENELSRFLMHDREVTMDGFLDDCAIIAMTSW